MGDGILLVAMAVFAGVVLLAGGLFAFNRFAGGVSGTACTMPCGYRAGAGDVWRRGVLRYDEDHLAHLGQGGRFVPEHQWPRTVLDLGQARALDAADAARLGLPPVAMAVACRYGEDSFELAMGTEHYTALRSWLEGAPPGWNANVA